MLHTIHNFNSGPALDPLSTAEGGGGGGGAFNLQPSKSLKTPKRSKPLP